MSEVAVVVLAGGAARRMGGAAKPTLRVGGVALLTRVLAAAGGAWGVGGDPRIVVVGPPELSGLVPAGARLIREEPPGGGPAYAARAGLEVLGGAARVALLAA